MSNLVVSLANPPDLVKVAYRQPHSPRNAVTFTSWRTPSQTLTRSSLNRKSNCCKAQHWYSKVVESIRAKLKKSISRKLKQAQEKPDKLRKSTPSSMRVGSALNWLILHPQSISPGNVSSIESCYPSSLLRRGYLWTGGTRSRLQYLRVLWACIPVFECQRPSRIWCLRSSRPGLGVRWVNSLHGSAIQYCRSPCLQIFWMICWLGGRICWGMCLPCFRQECGSGLSKLMYTWGERYGTDRVVYQPFDLAERVCSLIDVIDSDTSISMARVDDWLREIRSDNFDRLAASHWKCVWSALHYPYPFYKSQNLSWRSSDPDTHFSFVFVKATAFIFSPWPTKHPSCLPVLVLNILTLLSVEPATNRSPT